MWRAIIVHVELYPKLGSPERMKPRFQLCLSNIMLVGQFVYAVLFIRYSSR